MEVLKLSFAHVKCSGSSSHALSRGEWWPFYFFKMSYLERLMIRGKRERSCYPPVVLSPAAHALNNRLSLVKSVGGW